MGYKLKEVREETGMTQEQLAEKSGVSRQTIIALESGDYRVTTTKTIASLCNALGVTADRIFFVEPVKSI